MSWVQTASRDHSTSYTMGIMSSPGRKFVAKAVNNIYIIGENKK
jgi:hypothetical protein